MIIIAINVDSSLTGELAQHVKAQAMEVDPTGALILYSDTEGRFIDSVYAPGVWAYAEYGGE